MLKFSFIELVRGNVCCSCANFGIILEVERQQNGRENMGKWASILNLKHKIENCISKICISNIAPFRRYI